MTAEYHRNIQGWIAALNYSGENQLATEVEKDDGVKSEALKRAALIELPVYQSKTLKLARFLEHPEATLQNLQYPLYWASLLPLTASLAKRTKLGLGREELLDFAQQYKKSKDDYNILLSEYARNVFGGSIISNSDIVYVELARGDQINVAQGLTGKGDLFIAKRGKDNISFSYTFKDPNIRQLIWETLQYIRRRDYEQERETDIRFLKGYFEFALTELPGRSALRTIFLDYKTTPSFVNFNPTDIHGSA